MNFHSILTLLMNLFAFKLFLLDFYHLDNNYLSIQHNLLMS